LATKTTTTNTATGLASQVMFAACSAGGVGATNNLPGDPLDKTGSIILQCVFFGRDPEPPTPPPSPPSNSFINPKRWIEGFPRYLQGSPRGPRESPRYLQGSPRGPPRVPSVFLAICSDVRCYLQGSQEFPRNLQGPPGAPQGFFAICNYL
jgi:hypothetical protein